MTSPMKMIVQCDFDGTLTVEDMGFYLLDTFAKGEWRRWLEQYRNKEISVSEFNSRAFATLRTAKEELLAAIRSETRLREGFVELVAYCREKGFRLAIVSNGLDFYINSILADAGLGDVEAHAATSQFHPGGLTVQYIGPDGVPLNDDFKAAYTRFFREQGYKVAYVGNGPSDGNPASLSQHVFARDGLLEYCKEKNLPCQPFDDMHDVIKGLESI
jgi:2-hydroxy-3-keto-5-methylthiopentenyl-1-phosphate phosphatase